MKNLRNKIILDRKNNVISVEHRIYLWKSMWKPWGHYQWKNDLIILL